MKVKKEYAPEKVLQDSPVRQENFNHMVEEIRKALLKEDKGDQKVALFNTVLSGTKKDVMNAARDLDNNIDILTGLIEGMNLFHIVAARLPNNNKDSQEITGIIGFLASKNLNPLSKAKFDIGEDGEEQIITLSPPFFCNKTLDEDPEKKSGAVFSSLLKVAEQYATKQMNIEKNRPKNAQGIEDEGELLSNQFGKLGECFSSLPNEMVCTARADLFRLGNTHNFWKGDCFSTDCSSWRTDDMKVGEFIDDNHIFLSGYYAQIGKSVEYEQSIEIFNQAITSSLKGNSSKAVGDLQFSDTSRLGYQKIALENSILPSGTSNGISYAKIISPAELEKLQEQDPNIPDGTAIALVMREKNKVQEISRGIVPVMNINLKEGEDHKVATEFSKTLDSNAIYYSGKGNAVFIAPNDTNKMLDAMGFVAGQVFLGVDREFYVNECLLQFSLDDQVQRLAKSIAYSPDIIENMGAINTLIESKDGDVIEDFAMMTNKDALASHLTKFIEEKYKGKQAAISLFLKDLRELNPGLEADNILSNYVPPCDNNALSSQVFNYYTAKSKVADMSVLPDDKFVNQVSYIAKPDMLKALAIVGGPRFRDRLIDALQVGRRSHIAIGITNELKNRGLIKEVAQVG